MTFGIGDGVVMRITARLRYEMALARVVDTLGPPDYYFVQSIGHDVSTCGIGLLWPNVRVAVGGPSKNGEQFGDIRTDGVDSSEAVVGIADYSSDLTMLTKDGVDFPWHGL